MRTKRDIQTDKQMPHQHNIEINMSSGFFLIQVDKLLWRMQIFTTFSGMRPVKDTLHLQRLFEFFWRRTQFKMHLKILWFWWIFKCPTHLAVPDWWLRRIFKKISHDAIFIHMILKLTFRTGANRPNQIFLPSKPTPNCAPGLREIHWNILHSILQTT